MGGILSGWHWIIVLVVVLLLFGKRFPSVMKSLGLGIIEFRKGVKGVEEDVEESSSKTTQKKNETEKDITKQENK